MFMSRNFPTVPHFPVQPLHLCAFAHTFRKASTLDKYIMHLRTMSRLLGFPTVLPESIPPILRGMKKWHTPDRSSSLSSSQVLRLVKALLGKKMVPLARIIVIARHYMLRVEAELFPLQLDGRTETPGDFSWHSHVSLASKKATIFFRKRKADPNGAAISRDCVCGSQSPFLCGVCALRAQCRDHQESRLSPSVPIFFDFPPSRCLKELRDTAAPLGIHPVTWHGFRRGMTNDLVRGGTPVSRVARMGGWRSRVFVQYCKPGTIEAREHLDLPLLTDSEGE
jgi:hypothetical protein